MGTPNTAARNEAASDFATDYATATLEIRDATLILATHTLAGFAAPVSGVIAGNAIADVTNGNGGTADNAILRAGTKEYSLTVGTTGTDVIVANTTYIAGGTSEINSINVTF